MDGLNGKMFSPIFFFNEHVEVSRETFHSPYGHIAGDYVLQSLSKLVLKNVRESDSFFRWGGEEFIIILPETKLEKAKIVAEKIRGIIEDYNFKNGLKVMISLGVGEYKSNENIDHLIIRLDKAMLEAKSKGRNRIISA